MADEKTRRFAASSIFPSLFLSMVGLLVGQAGVARMSGSWVPHALFAVPGMVLAGLALYRARMHWSMGTAMPPGQDKGPDRSFDVRDGAWWVLLFGTGLVVALSAASVFLVGVVASLLYLVPWTAIPVCRTRFLASSMITLAGALAWLVLHGIPVPAPYYLAVAWMVTMPPTLATCLVLAVLPHDYRVRQPARGADPGVDTAKPVPR